MLALATGLSLMLYLLAWIWPPAAWLARPLVWLATLFHELGHGIAALALGGQLVELAVYADGSGVALHRGAYSELQRAVIAAAGPLGPPLAALALFASLRHPALARALLGLLGALLLIALLLWVRNVFGFIFIGFVAASLLVLAMRASPRGLLLTCGFLGLQMCLSTFSQMDYLFSAGANTGAGQLPSDTAQIAAALGLNYLVWGGLLAAVALAVTATGLALAWRLR
ncbi:MAG: M50 family metallopeptidase [Aquimonas sp.]|nr:M50 family metallopeptidase [Aquimonas sp.]